MSLKAGGRLPLYWHLGATELAAGTSFEIVAPAAGYLSELSSICQVAIVTGGAITVLTGAAGGTTVAGLGLTIPDAQAKGAVLTDLPTTGTATRLVAKGDRIQIVPAAAFNGGGALDGWLYLDSADKAPQAGYQTPSGA